MTMLFSILALGFLIFIHELGHYWMARKLDIEVEVFSIGLGKAIYSFKRGDTKWMIGWIPFGGYVQYKGEDPKNKIPAHKVTGGFYAASPWARLKVALAGPAVNILFALLAFVVIWSWGGRVKPVGEYTNRIGWVDPQSELFSDGIRPGDHLLSYNDYPFTASKDHIIAPMLADETIKIQGFKKDYQTTSPEPFELTVKPYFLSQELGLKTSGILSPANFVYVGNDSNSAMKTYNAYETGDRVVWFEGHFIYSLMQLSKLLEEEKAFITYIRNGKRRHARVDRVSAKELKFNNELKEELTDWSYAADMGTTSIRNLTYIPYNVSAQAIVEGALELLDTKKNSRVFDGPFLSYLESPLQPGDKIIAVDGTPISSAAQMLSLLQVKKVHVIVDRQGQSNVIANQNQLNKMFENSINPQQLTTLVSKIGVQLPRQIQEGSLRLIEPYKPLAYRQFIDNKIMAKAQEMLQSIADPAIRQRESEKFDALLDKPILGIVNIQDQKFMYNPHPLDQFYDASTMIWRNLYALVSGAINPKWMAGPVGIVSVMNQGAESGNMELLYWLGIISLNLGLLNLLPIPVLDGGRSLFFIYEGITGHQISPKMMERLIFPFVILLVGFFIYITYYDVLRLFGIS